MRKILLSIFLVHCVIIGMEEGSSSSTLAATISAPKANYALWRAVKESNHSAVLSALRDNQDQNYLWQQSDSDQYRDYVDLTAAMYAIKRLRAYNRRQLASNVATALTWDLGNAALKYVLNSYAVQYPMLNYVDPIRQSRTAALLLGPQTQENPVVSTYNPAKRIARDLLIKPNTNLTIERAAKWDGNSVTVETYLNNMLGSWNPLTKKDGQDLSFELGQILRARQGISQNDDGFMMRDGNPFTMMGFAANNQRHRGIIVLNDGDY